MSNELVVWRKPPLISKSLYTQKLRLTPKELLWVYSDFALAIISVPWIALSIVWLSLPFTMKGWAIVMLVVASLAFLVGLIAFGWQVGEDSSWTHDPLKLNLRRSEYLTHRGRRALCLMDRNRRRAPHQNERSWRLPDIEHCQYSVWTDFRTDNYTGPGIMFSIIEHLPNRYGLGPRKVQLTEKTVYRTTEEDSEGTRLSRNGIAIVAKKFLPSPTHDEAMETLLQMEQFADGLEAESYGMNLQTAEMHRLALQMRH